MLELEKTYLAKYLPSGYKNSPHKRIVDVYYPVTARHPTLRLRQLGDKCELTKKEPVEDNDSSQQLESTINLNQGELQAFRKMKGKESSKVRYYCPYQGHTAEITVFDKKLKGLILIDFEFDSVEAMNKFEMPDFCLADVTPEEFAAGGILAGKSYKDMEEVLRRYGYKKIMD